MARSEHGAHHGAQEYFAIREKAEREAARIAKDECARRVHLDLALRYRRAQLDLPMIEL